MAARQQFDGVWQAKTSQNLEGFLAEIGAGKTNYPPQFTPTPRVWYRGELKII